MRLAAGVTIAQGRYRLERRLGAGGMASVWLGHDVRLDRLVAVKVIADTMADDDGWLARFERGARATAALSHPNIVQVFDYGIEDGRPYLVMEHVAGKNLSEGLADEAAPRPDPEALARQLLDAIAHVHAAGIVHRDIKPANIMLDEQGNAHLTDFGIAHSKDAPSLTQTGMVIGTLKYLAPEISAGQPASPASDLYSVGMVLREVAGANPPPNMAQLIGALTHPDPARRASSASSASALLSEQSAPGIVTAPTRAMTTPATRLLTPSAPARVATTTHSCRQRPQPTPKAPSAHRLMALAAIAALVLVVLALVFTLSGGDNGSSNVNPSAARDQPARAQAPLSEQLRALDRIVEHARGR